jgi:inhibitor of cysteine peptidase
MHKLSGWVITCWGHAGQVFCLLKGVPHSVPPNSENVMQSMQSIGENDNGRTVDIRLGGSLQVILPENATTGYRWAIDRCDEEIIEALATEPRYKANAIGSGGEVVFIFQAKKIGNGEIVLKHWRHWEGDSSITTRFCIRFQVRP